MSTRCSCCNRIITRSLGYRVLPDGTKVEEDFCTVCRNEVNALIYGSKNVGFTQFEGLLDQQMQYGSVTPQRVAVY